MLTQLMTDLYTRTVTNIQTMNKSMSHNTLSDQFIRSWYKNIKLTLF